MSLASRLAEKIVRLLPDSISRRIEPLLGSDFVQKVAETFAARIALIAMGLVTGVLIARSLGPEGRGIQVVIGTVTAVGIQFGNLGLHSSNTYYVAKEPRLLGTLVANSLLVALGLGGLGAGVAWLVVGAFPGISPIRGVYLAIALAGIPIGLSYLLLQNLLLGIHKVRAYNVIELVVKAGVVIALLAVIFLQRISVGVVAGVGLVSSVVGAVWALAAVRRVGSLPLRISLDALRDHLGYGFKAYLAALFAYTVLKADVLMCSYLLGAEATGQYSIAVAMADLVYMLPVVVGTIAFPRLAAIADHAERWVRARTIAKGVAGIMLALAAVAALLAYPAVLLLYGREFLPSVIPFILLLPGVVMLGVNTILMNFFAAEGFPPIAVVSPGVASLLNILLNVILMPRIGISGASVASSLSYGLMLAISLIYIRRRRSSRPQSSIQGID